jgi:hypothetical protein
VCDDVTQWIGGPFAASCRFFEGIGLFLLYDAVNMVRFQCFVILLDGGRYGVKFLLYLSSAILFVGG